MNSNFRSNEPYNKDRVYARELYDYEKDPLETVSVVDEKEYAAVVKDMDDKIQAFFKSQLKIGTYKIPLKDRKSANKDKEGVSEE
jgi:hypothetical protein